MQRIATLGLIFLLAACGGGSGGNEPVVAGVQDLFGASEFWHMGAVAKPGSPWTSFIGSAAAVSQNEMQFDDEVNSAGTLSQASILADATIEAPRDLILKSAVRAPWGRGSASPTGRYAVVGNDDPAAGTQFHVLARKPETFTLADAQGRYHFTLMSYDHDDDEYGTIYGQAEIDANGSMQLVAAQANLDGELCPIPLAIEFEFVLGPNGQADITIIVLGTPTYNLRGGFAEGGDVALFGGAVTADRPAIIGALVRQHAAPGEISGDYRIAGYLDQLFTDLSFTGTATFGATTAALDLTGTNGATTDTDQRDVSYRIEFDGRMTLTIDAAEYVGGISPGGEIAILTGPLTVGQPGTIVLVRR